MTPEPSGAVSELLLQAFLAPEATEDQVAAVAARCPFVVPPELIHPGGVRILWQYVQLVPLTSISARGLDTHRTELEAHPGIHVRWFDVATEDVEVKARVRSFNLQHFGAATAP